MATEQQREYGRRWRAANQDRVRTNRARYAEKNKEKIRLAAAAWAAAHPDRRRAYQKEYVALNTVRIKARRAQYGQRMKSQTRAKLLLRKYNLTLEQRDALLAKQDGKCAICLTDTPGGKGWVIDHNHRTGKVRGILCPTCNTGIGHLKDDVMVVKAAVHYLETA